MQSTSLHDSLACKDRLKFTEELQLGLQTDTLVCQKHSAQLAGHSVNMHCMFIINTSSKTINDRNHMGKKEK